MTTTIIGKLGGGFGPALLGAVAIALFSAAPASSAEWTVDCLWARTPASDRAAFVAGWGSGHRQAFANLNRAALKAAVAACGIPETDEPQAQRIYNVYASGLSALAILQSQHGISRGQVLNAWAGVPAADRNRFAAIAPGMHRDPQHIAIFEGLIDQLAQRLNVTDTAAKGQLRQVVYSASMLQGLGRGAL